MVSTMAKVKEIASAARGILLEAAPLAIRLPLHKIEETDAFQNGDRMMFWLLK